jgi:4-carboxymuconolactone decarboxylase
LSNPREEYENLARPSRHGTSFAFLAGDPRQLRGESMTEPLTTTGTAAGPEPARVYKNVPQLARLREQVLLGDVWKQPELSRRDRILVTCGILAAGGKIDELKHWMRQGVEAGLTLDELRGLIVQVTFYAGWPAGLGAGKAALELLEADGK